MTAQLSTTRRAGEPVSAHRAPPGPWARVACAALLALLGSLAAPGAALAQTDAVALYVEGPGAEAVRTAVLEALPPGIKLADESAFRQEFVREGQNRPLGKDLDLAAIDRVRRAARVTGVAAALVVRVRRDQTARRVMLLVVPAWKTPASAEEVPLALTPHAEDVATLASALGQSLDPYAPPPARSTEVPAAAPPASESGLREGQNSAPAAPAVTQPPFATRPATAFDVTEGAIRPTRTPAELMATSVLDIAVGSEIVARHFDYTSGIQPEGARYTLFPAAGVDIRGQLYPLANANVSWARDIGFVAEYLRIFSQMNDTSSLPDDVSPSSYSAGLRARIHPGENPRLILGLSVEYTSTSRLAVGPAPFELPNVTYRSVRPAIDTRVYFGRLSVFQEVAFRALVDQDAISTRFYGPRGYGVVAEVGAALLLHRGIEARLGFDYELYSFAFHPPPGAAFEAGSARDQLYGVRLALAFVL